jgi:hypothetical protein
VTGLRRVIKAKYRGLSTAAAKAPPPVEMTCVWGVGRTCKGKGKSWLGKGIHSHSSQKRDEWGTRHDSKCGRFAEGDKSEIQGSLRCGGKSAASGRDDVCFGGGENCKGKGKGKGKGWVRVRAG